MIYIIYSAMNDENNTILKVYVLKAINELRTKKKRQTITVYVNTSIIANYKNEDIFIIILSLLDENIITSKPTKQGLPSYFILNKENDNEEEEETSVDKSIKDDTDSRDKYNVKCDQHNLISKDVDEISFLNNQF